jgi:hypothetical protein
MPVFDVIVEVLEVRSYQVEADDSDEAESLVRSDRRFMTFDIINDDIQNITVTT